KDKPSKSLIKRDTQIYINVIKNNPIDILAHPGYCIFADMVEVAKCCRDYNTLFEIDARKEHISDETWLEVAKTGVKFVLNSDAHSPNSIGNIDLALKMFERTSFPTNQIVNVNGLMPEKLRFSEYKNRS
ncbi:MAG: hypothetical protein J6Q38_02665, partial [Clostridia bacterium]|nr:hypothetical protein [Clostridia bacterium]